MPVFVDTNVLFATASARDEHQEPGLAIVQAIDHRELPKAIVTNYVIAETLNLVSEKISLGAANGTLNRLLEDVYFEIVHAPQANLLRRKRFFGSIRPAVRGRDGCGLYEPRGNRVSVFVR